MDRVGIRELRQNLSVFVERVKEGEAFEATEYGRSVALLGRLVDGPIERLEREGRIVRRAAHRLADIGSPLPARPGEPALSELLEELREDVV
jgi:antitoxin (DNA-binding transcriptional repressor) of toxin-antitoxin stability system